MRQLFSGRRGARLVVFLGYIPSIGLACLGFYVFEYKKIDLGVVIIAVAIVFFIFVSYLVVKYRINVFGW